MNSSFKTITQTNQFRQWVPISIILLLAAALYLYQLGTEGFWIDELTSVTDIQTGRGLPPRNLVRPLYYMLLSVWSRFSTEDAWLRGLSVLFALGSIFLVYQLGRRLAGEPEGLIAALLLALSPLFINHAQEVRMYTMSTCLGLGGTLALTYALLTEKPKQPSLASMLWWTGLRLLAILTVPLNVTLLVADLILVGCKFRHQPRVLLNFGKWFLLLGIIWFPFVFSVIKFATSSSSSYVQAKHVAGRQVPGLADVVRTLKFYTVWPFSAQYQAIASGTAFGAIVAGFYKAFTGLLAGLIGAALLKKHRSSKLFWAVTWAFLPLAQIFVFSHVSTSIWVTRYLVFVCPYVFILIAAGLMRLWQQWRVVAIVVGFVYLLAVSGGLVRYYSVQDRPNYRGVVGVINTYDKPSDVIVWSMYYQKALAHYYDGSAKIYWRPIPNTVDKLKLERWLSSIPSTQSRIWLASQVSQETSQLLRSTLEARFEIKKHQSFKSAEESKRNMEVFLVTPR